MPMIAMNDRQSTRIFRSKPGNLTGQVNNARKYAIYDKKNAS